MASVSISRLLLKQSAQQPGDFLRVTWRAVTRQAKGLQVDMGPWAFAVLCPAQYGAPLPLGAGLRASKTKRFHRSIYFQQQLGLKFAFITDSSGIHSGGCSRRHWKSCLYCYNISLWTDPGAFPRTT